MTLRCCSSCRRLHCWQRPRPVMAEALAHFCGPGPLSLLGITAACDARARGVFARCPEHIGELQEPIA